MKHILLSLIFFGLITSFGCSKSSNTIDQPTSKTPEAKLGSVVKLQASVPGKYYYILVLTEISAIDNSTVYHKDTTIFEQPSSIEFRPHVGNTVHAEVNWRVINSTFEPTVKLTYNNVEQTGFVKNTLNINPPFDWYKSINFIAK